MVSSSSPSPRTWRYNVFTSFHGPDVRKTLLSHLRKQFSYNGITMFDDQGIQRSQTISPALIEAIRESRISIIVLSKNYASSSWCLDELLEILKCKEGIGQIVMTVFYGVDPSDVRKQTRDFGIAFNETCALKTEEQSQKWIQALTDVGNIAGEDFQNWDNEAEMIEKIARDVSYKLNATPSRDFDGMVGLDDHLKEMESLLDLDYVGVKIVGISGPTGIGKSTIARALHSRLSNRFQHTCFVENLRENYETGLDEYGRKLRLHEHLLSKMLNLTSISICHLGVIQERLHDKKVLIILDDVESVNQLEVLANIMWFGPGSRVIVTTKNKVILLQHDINDIYHVGFPCLGLRIIPDIPTNITSFSVPNTKLEELPASLIYCCRLKEVDISGSVNLKTFSTHFPTSVRELDLSNSGIERITDCIKGLRKLQDLNLSGCKGLESLPELPGSLQVLNLLGCKRLTSLPELPGSLKWLVAIDCESLERVSDPLNTPKTKLYFTNCFNLDREARQSIIHQSVGRGWAVIPGREVPAEYDHRARGNSLAIPHSSSNMYKVCLVILPRQHQPENISSTLSYRCKVINNLENSLDVEFLLEDVSMFQTEHLFIFHPRLPFIDPSEVNRKIVLEFRSKHQDFDIIECGVQILADETNGSSKVGFGDEDDISNLWDSDESDDDDSVTKGRSKSESGEEFDKEDDEDTAEDRLRIHLQEASDEEDDENCYY